MYEENDFILIDYTASVKETGVIFDTTYEEIAEAEKLMSDKKFESVLMILGQNWLFKTIDEELLKAEKENITVTIKPEDAFGIRDSRNLQTVPFKALTKRGITPAKGARIMFDGKSATIRTTSGGRAVLDFNHPLAGKTLVYKINIREKIEDFKEKIFGLIHRRVPDIDPHDFKLRVSKKSITIIHPEESYYLEGIQLMKRGISADIKRYLENIEKVKFIEVF